MWFVEKLRFCYKTCLLKREKRTLAFFFAISLLASVLIARFVYYFSYMEPDSTSYLFQAKIFADGKLSLPPPPDFGFSSSPHINILNGKWYSKYPFGNALILSLGVLTHTPWIIAPLLTAFTVIVVYFLIKEIYNRELSFITITLVILSPAFLVISGLWMSENTSRFFLALFVLFLVKSLHRYKWYYAAISGFALGYAFNTRPIAAIGFGISCGIFVLYRLFSSEKKREIFRTISVFLLTFIFMILICLAWNKHMTGEFLRFTHNAAQPYDKIGFGLRSEGYNVDISKGYLFTPQIATKRLFKNVLPCIFHNALGWGKYRSTPLGYGSTAEHIIAFFPIILTFLLMLVPFFSKSRCQWDFLLLGIFLSVSVLYFFFYFDGSTFGYTAAHARYYNEVTILAIIPLIARGIYITFRRISSTKSVMIPALILIAILFANTGFTFTKQANALANYSPIYQQLPRMVKAMGLHHVVIFLPDTRESPIGDYPFRNLTEADIVYFRLGLIPEWGLTNYKLQSVREQYFRGREAYIYDEGSNRLRRIMETGTSEMQHSEDKPMLVGEWTFNEGAGGMVTDTSGSKNHGYIRGYAKWIHDGKKGTALDFNGKDAYVEIMDSKSLSPLNAATVSVWIKPRSYSHMQPTIICKGGMHQDFDLLIQSENDEVLWHISSMFTNYVAKSASVPPIGEWTHLTATYRAGDSIDIYINGKLSGRTAISGERIPSLNPLYIGKSFWPDRFFDGLIDEVKIYRGCLDRDGIQKLAVGQ